ncbi:MAG: DNRLRE domain-containing protein [Calditrichaeota bacterium]|nr:DNRLRE domain-containing protein [Calditrichota bacterium]
MNQSRCFILLIGLLGLLVASCEKNKPLPDGYQRIIGNQEGEIADKTLLATPESGAYEAKRIDTSQSTDLLLGTYEQYHSGIFLQFSNLPDTINVISAELKLQIQDRLAPGDTTYWNTPRQATVNIYLADTTDIGPENPPLPDNNFLLATQTINSDSLNGISFALDTTLVNQWLKTDSSGAQHGFWLETESAEYMAVFYAYESLQASYMPRMTLIYNFTDSTGDKQDTLTYYTTKDQFIFLDPPENLALDANFLYMGRGVAFRSYLDFDLSEFDTTYHINRAILELTSNAAHSIRNAEGANNALIYRMTSPWGDASLWETPQSASYSPTVADSVLTFDITPTVQAWISQQYENYGFQLQAFSEGTTLARIAFYSVNADSALQPKIYLYYTTPANHEF